MKILFIFISIFLCFIVSITNVYSVQFLKVIKYDKVCYINTEKIDNVIIVLNKIEDTNSIVNYEKGNKLKKYYYEKEILVETRDSTFSFTIKNCGKKVYNQLIEYFESLSHTKIEEK